MSLETYGVPYMGSKKKLVTTIIDLVKDQNYSTVLDLFTVTRNK